MPGAEGQARAAAGAAGDEAGGCGEVCALTVLERSRSAPASPSGAERRRRAPAHVVAGDAAGGLVEFLYDPRGGGAGGRSAAIGAARGEHTGRITSLSSLILTPGDASRRRSCALLATTSSDSTSRIWQCDGLDDEAPSPGGWRWRTIADLPTGHRCDLCSSILERPGAPGPTYFVALAGGDSEVRLYAARWADE